jgi:hypothetical protein
MCSNPVYAVQDFNPATGQYSERCETTVAEARADNGLCGPEALLFEPRTTFQRTVIAAVTSKPGLWTMFILGAVVLDGLLR